MALNQSSALSSLAQHGEQHAGEGGENFGATATEAHEA